MIRAFALAFLAGCASGAFAQSNVTQSAVDKGQAIVAKVCVACHGTDGNSPIAINPKLAGQHPEYLAKQLADFKANGTRKNPVMLGMSAGLSAEDIKNVSMFYAAQKPKDGAAKGADSAAIGRKIYRGGNVGKGLAACASCHGATGLGMPSLYPRLAGQHAEYTESQ